MATPLAYTYAYTNDKEELYAVNKREINRLMRTYVRGMKQQYPDSNFFPDANLTLRVAYGHVQGFSPKDAVYYTPYSTLDGIMEKENPEIYDYVVEPKLKQLYRDKDYGRYANVRGEMPVGFIATNHTTGGNSGSPVLNAADRHQLRPLLGRHHERPPVRPQLLPQHQPRYTILPLHHRQICRCKAPYR